LELDREKLLVVHCKGGYRAQSPPVFLRRAGFRDVANLTGRFEAWKTAGLPYTVVSNGH
jgi:hydroxyacylglutathione hydrolase